METQVPAKKSILVIDDNPCLRELQKTILEMEGFEVLTADGGTEALHILSKTNRPSLILLDMNMKDMSGSEFLVQLEEKNPVLVEEVPVVFHTALKKVPKSKAAGCIEKSGSIDKFLESIYRFIQKEKSTPCLN